MWHRERSATGGLVILVIGAIFLLRNMGIITQPVWSILWPCLLIVVGIGAIFKRTCKKKDD